MEKVTLAPLAITDVDDTSVCVSGISDTGKWIRPEQLFKADIDMKEGPNFLYKHKTDLFVLPSTSDEMRVEDRDIVREKPVTIYIKFTPEEWEDFLVSNLDPSVESIFNAGRSVGLIKAGNILKVDYGRTLGGTRKARVTFTDQTNQEYNFILADKLFKAFIVKNLNEKLTLSDSVEKRIIESLPENMTHFTVGLTKRMTGFPGPYDGCHPLITGVHTIPDYETLFYEEN